MKKIVAICVCLMMFMPLFAMAEDSYKYDLGVKQSDVYFSVPADQLIENQRVKLYAKVYNFGTEDVSASVLFYVNQSIVGVSQPVSVRAGGLADEVFVEFKVPAEDFFVTAEIQSPTPSDQYLLNNKALINKITPKKDNDGDGISDDADNDDDNDGLTDEREAEMKTNPKRSDTDGDGSDDSLDYFPFDSSRFEKPEPVPEPVVVPEPVIKKKVEVAEPVIQETVVEPEAIEEAGVGVDKEERNLNASEFFSTVKIAVEQVGWATYDFSFQVNDESLNVEELSYTWDFGDGNIEYSNGIHKFDSPGTYYVKLKTKGLYGNNISDLKEINVPFLAVENLYLWMLIVVGFVVVISTIIYLRKK